MTIIITNKKVIERAWHNKLFQNRQRVLYELELETDGLIYKPFPKTPFSNSGGTTLSWKTQKPKILKDNFCTKAMQQCFPLLGHYRRW